MPVTVEIDSMVPVTMARDSLLNSPMKPGVSARSSSLVTDAPTSLRM